MNDSIDNSIKVARQVFVLFKEVDSVRVEEVVGVFESFEKMTQYVRFLQEISRSSPRASDALLRWRHQEYVCDALYDHVDPIYREELKKNGFSYK